MGIGGKGSVNPTLSEILIILGKLDLLEDVYSIISENFAISWKSRAEWLQIILFFYHWAYQAIAVGVELDDIIALPVRAEVTNGPRRAL